MSFLFLGFVILIVGIIFLRLAIKDKDNEGVTGLTALIIAALILIIFFGFIYASFYT